jgi:DNA-binding NarL/FixJ family response regulator
MYPWFGGVGLLDDHSSSNPETALMPKRYPPEFRRKVLDLVASGCRLAQIAADLDISEQCIDVCAAST